MTTIDLHIPRPHAGGQAQFIDSPAKRKVIVAGRRGGKTTGVSILAARKALDGRRVLEAAPTSDQTGAFWEAISRYFAPLIELGYATKNESSRLLELKTGGRIRCKTAWNADTLRGDHADLLILDEYSIMDPSAWDEVGAPMLLDNDGDAVFIFTPKRRNHAYRVYTRAKTDGTGRWAAWHFVSSDNPHLSKAALSEITEDMSEDAYRQEILAEFLEGAGAVFRNIPSCLHAPNDTTPEQHAGHLIVGGVDWGKQQDRTAISLICRDCRREVALQYFNQVDYTVQLGRIAAIYDRWQVHHLIPESNAMGAPIIEQMQRGDVNQGIAPMRVIPFTTTAVSKPPLIESLALAFEREECQWLDDPIATTELEAYERKVSPMTGRPSYSAPDGMHDDTVMARALAWSAMTTASPLAGL